MIRLCAHILWRRRSRRHRVSDSVTNCFRADVLILGTLPWLCILTHAGANLSRSGTPDPSPVAERRLFIDLPESETLNPRIDATAIRQRYVTIDLEQLPQAGNAESESIVLNLFPNVTFEGLVEKMETRGPTRYTIGGRLTGMDAGSFLLVRDDEIVVADVFAQDHGNFEVRYAGSGRFVVRETNESALKPCGNGTRQMAFKPANTLKSERTTAVDRDGEPTFDMMIVYTSAARAAAGGTAAMNALAELFVAAANTTYQNSLINARMRLVYAGEVYYLESGSASVDLSLLTYTNDGYLEEVHALRNQYGADTVSLLVHNIDSCGIGWMHFGPTRAFSVVDIGCGSSTFVHEVGHNMGCAHDRDNAGSQGEFPYSFGHRFFGQSGSQFRTIMAYSPGARIQHFSNPNVNYNGTPTGIPEGQANAADNAQTVNTTAPTMVDYRPAADMTDCNGNFVADSQDILNGASDDCNENEVPDECDVASGGSDDDNGNYVPDECECDALACDDGVPCTLDTCDPVTDACTHATGAIPYGDLNFDGTVDVDDILCLLAAFQNISECPQSDVFPCGGDGSIDVDDIMAILGAFNGVFACPSICS